MDGYTTTTKKKHYPFSKWIFSSTNRKCQLWKFIIMYIYFPIISVDLTKMDKNNI